MARLLSEQEFQDSFDQNDLLNIVGGGAAPAPAPMLLLRQTIPAF